MTTTNQPLDFDVFEQIRHVQLGDTGYRLEVFATSLTDRRGQTVLAYRFYEPGKTEPLFTGTDFPGSPMHSDDADETLRSLLIFLTLRPGDTDPDYFAGYTTEQMAWCMSEAEELSMFAAGDFDRIEEGHDYWPLRDIADDGSVAPEWPSVAEVAAALEGCADDLGEDDDESSIDVRLQVTEGSTWAIHTGDASYDTDHRGYWGASSADSETDLTELAAALLDQAKEQWFSSH
jgi:hypothetical protein